MTKPVVSATISYNVCQMGRGASTGRVRILFRYSAKNRLDSQKPLDFFLQLRYNSIDTRTDGLSATKGNFYMCKPADVIDALLKIHKNAWKDALRYVVERSMAEHEELEELRESSREMSATIARLREQIAQLSPKETPWFETVVVEARMAPEVESIFPPARQ